MDQEPSINYPPLKAEAQGRPILIPQTLAFHEPEADRLPRCGCNKVDALHHSGLPLEPTVGMGARGAGCSDALRQGGSQDGKAAAAKRLEQPAIPKQHVRAPACQGGQHTDQTCSLEQGNAKQDRMVGDVEAPPDCRRIQCLPVAGGNLSQYLARKRYPPFESMQT